MILEKLIVNDIVAVNSEGYAASGIGGLCILSSQLSVISSHLADKEIKVIAYIKEKILLLGLEGQKDLSLFDYSQNQIIK